MKKKLLSILLAAIMVMTLLPTVAFAEGKTEVKNVTVTTNFENLYGLKFGNVKDRLFTNASDGENDLEIVEVVAYDKNGDKRLTNNDAFGSGAYILGVTVKAAADTYFATKAEIGEGADYLEKPDDFTVTPTATYVYPSLTGIINSDFQVDIYFVDKAEGATAEEKYANIKENVGYCQLLYKIDVDCPSAKITGRITAADFAYEMVIPSDTTLTEDNHKDVLLGADGKVSIEVTKHGCSTVDISYTVDLANGTLTDGNNHDIAATYKYKQGEAEFAAIVDDDDANATEVTVYTGGEVVDSFVNVTADSTQWDAAPVGEYNATVVFNFKNEEAAAATTIGDIFPADLRITSIDTMSDNAYSNGDERIAGIVNPNSECDVFLSGNLETNVANQFMVYIDEYVDIVPLTTVLTPIDGGYQYIAHDETYGAPGTGDVVTVFTMESDKLTKITVTLYIESKETVIEMTPPAAE